jgi:hypothetical protein
LKLARSVIFIYYKHFHKCKKLCKPCAAKKSLEMWRLKFRALQEAVISGHISFIKNTLCRRVVIWRFLFLLVTAPPPTFTSPQTNFTAAVGTQVSLLCRVNITVSPESKYWWTKNGFSVSRSKKHQLKKFRYLRVKDVEKSDAGDFVCWTSNGNGHKIQRKITLNVVGKN